jgi:hypothetical protein
LTIDFLCECGHDMADHPKVGRYAHYSGSAGDYMVCDKCFRANRPAGIKQLDSIECREYVPDNLKYLEDKYMEKQSSG